MSQIRIIRSGLDTPRWFFSYFLGAVTFVIIQQSREVFPAWVGILCFTIFSLFTAVIEGIRSNIRRVPKAILIPTSKVQPMTPFDKERYKHEWLEERASILEHEAGLPVDEAERQAIEQWQMEENHI